MLDAFAAEYGWNKEDVLGLYPEEAECLFRRVRIRDLKRQMERVESLSPYLDAIAVKKIRNEIMEQIDDLDDHPRTIYKDQFTGDVKRKMDALDEQVAKNLRERKKK